MADSETEYIKQGLNWDEAYTSEGTVKSWKFDFPLAPIKAAARLVAYHKLGEEVPEGVTTQMGDLFFGQVTRQLGSFGDEGFGMVSTILRMDQVELGQMVGELSGRIGSQVFSGGTRFLDTVNQAAALARGKDYAPLDRRQGKEYLNKGLRYVEQIMALAGREHPERYDAAAGTFRADLQKKLGEREIIGHTDTMKMLNFVGIPYYEINNYSEFPEADNHYAKMFFQIAEPRATALLDNPKFIEAPLSVKQKLVTEKVLTPSREALYKILERGIRVDDQSFRLMIKLGKEYKLTDIDSAMTELKIDTELGSLSKPQLEAIESYLKYRDELYIRGMD